MSKDLQQMVSAFLQRHADMGKPVLLALSGGPDSTALFHILRQCRERQCFPLHVAHVDHGWREESSREAQLLQSQVESLGLPWHGLKLNPHEIKGNLEEACRQARLQFFQSLCRTYHCQAVALGHHADDQAETVLKRIFEGASLTHLCGIQAVKVMPELTLWRPLLGATKQEIGQWLKAHHLDSFEDKTNTDSRFTRGRMRTALLPMLSGQFGKQIAAPLSRLGADAQELRHYLDVRIETYLSDKLQGRMGLLVDLRQQPVAHPLEYKHLVRKLCEEAALLLSRESVELISQWLAHNTANRQVSAGLHSIYIDRRCIFMPDRAVPMDLPLAPQALQLGTLHFGSWQIMVEKITGACPACTEGGWKAVWRGRCQAVLPGHLNLADCLLAAPNHLPKAPAGASTDFSSLDKLWTNHKVPAFMRSKAPVIWHAQSGIVHEFLSGQAPKSPLTAHGFYRVSLFF